MWQVFQKLAIRGAIALAGIVLSAPLLGADSRTTCDVLDNRGDLVGRTVVVRGLLGGSDRHGYTIQQGPNRDPCPGWRSRFLTAPSVIPLDLGVVGTRTIDPGVSSCIAASRRGGPTLVTIEVVGTLLERSRSPMIFRRADGSYFSLFAHGFGRSGEYPVMILVQSATCTKAP